MTRAHVPGVVLALLVVLLPAGASPDEITHRLESGETLEEVSRRYWGDDRWAELLRTHNGLPKSEGRPGLELRVPLPAEKTAREGDSWASLAQATLGDRALGPVLAELNDRSPSQPPRVGEPVRVPALVTYRLPVGETLAAVARRFLEGTGDWTLLARLNGFGNPDRLRVGTKMRVPILAPNSPPEKSEARPTPDPTTPPVSTARPTPATPIFQDPLRATVNAYLDGRYEEAEEELETLRPEVLARGAPEEQVLLLEYLTFVRVAFDNQNGACEAYLALRALDPTHDWSPVEVSPKISRMTSLCEMR
jgi:LysM repeat protein